MKTAHRKEGMELGDVFQEEATGTIDQLDVKEKKEGEGVRDDAPVSDLASWKSDGVIDRNRGMWRRSWLPVKLRSWEEKQVGMQRLKYEAQFQKKGQEGNIS